MRTTARRLAALLCALLATALPVTACHQRPAPSPTNPMSGIDLHPDTTGAGQEPGALVAAHSLPNIDRRLSSTTSVAALVEYTSTAVGGGRTRVSGTVFAPASPAPPGGWPVVVYGHPTTGIDADCAPSRSPTLLGAASTVMALVNAGYVVTVPDYQGLGASDGDHPYLDPITAGRNVIDAVRATRRLVPGASDRWAAVGLSQGGQAVWAANELAAGYGGGLALLGTVSLSPPTDLTGLATGAASGTLTREQQGALQLLLESLHREHPDLDLDDYRRGPVTQDWALLSSCDPGKVGARVEALDRITADDLRPATPEAQAKLEQYLRERSLPQGPAAAPMLVVFGGKDQFMPEPWTRRALGAACAMGDVIDIQFQPDKGHSDIDVSMTYRWLQDRFAGLPAANGCDAVAAMNTDKPTEPDFTGVEPSAPEGESTGGGQ